MLEEVAIIDFHLVWTHRVRAVVAAYLYQLLQCLVVQELQEPQNLKALKLPEQGLQRTLG